MGDPPVEGRTRDEVDALDQLMLTCDPQARRIPAAQHARMVGRALADGDALARETIDRSGADPEIIAQHLGIPVTTSGVSGGFGSTVVYAEYGTRPPRIVLYDAPIAELEQRLRTNGMRELLGSIACRQIFIAHELYHHLDLARGDHAITRRERVTLFRIGRFAWTSGVAAAAEIAAGAFAQRLLGLPFHPRLLDAAVRVREGRCFASALEETRAASGGGS